MSDRQRTSDAPVSSADAIAILKRNREHAERQRSEAAQPVTQGDRGRVNDSADMPKTGDRAVTQDPGTADPTRVCVDCGALGWSWGAFPDVLCTTCHVTRLRRNDVTPPDPFGDVDPGAQCTRAGDEVCGCCARWRDAREQHRPDAQDEPSAASLAEMPELTEEQLASMHRRPDATPEAPRPATFVDGDRVHVGSWANMAGTITGWRGDISEWWVQLDDTERFPCTHAFKESHLARLSPGDATLVLSHREAELVREHVSGDLRGANAAEFTTFFQQRLSPFVEAKWDAEEAEEERMRRERAKP